MKLIPFAALPVTERDAIIDALRRSGVAPRQVCVSKLELGPVCAGEGLTCLATVSARDWGLTYDTSAGWIAQLERDLGQLRPGG